MIDEIVVKVEGDALGIAVKSDPCWINGLEMR